MTDFDAFYAARRQDPCPAATGLLLTADGSGFAVLPQALRPATARAAAARAGPPRIAAGLVTPPTCASPGNAPPSWPASPTSRPPRTADDVIITALFSTAPRAARTGDSDAARHGPKAGGKTVFASARKPIPQVIADAFAEAQRRDPAHARPWFAVRPPSSAGCGRGSKRQ